MPTALAISRNVYLQSLSIISLCLRLLHSLLHVQVGNIFFGLLQTEIFFSLYKDTLLEPWISQFSKKVFFWMVEFCAKLKNPISLIFLTRFTTNSGQRLAILTSLVFEIHLRSAVAFSTSNTQLLYVCFKLWYFRCVSVKSSSKLILFKRFLTIACMIYIYTKISKPYYNNLVIYVYLRFISFCENRSSQINNQIINPIDISLWWS